MLCTEIVFDIQYNFCTQHVLQKEELLTKIYLYLGLYHIAVAMEAIVKSSEGKLHSLIRV